MTTCGGKPGGFLIPQLFGGREVAGTRRASQVMLLGLLVAEQPTWSGEFLVADAALGGGNELLSRGMGLGTVVRFRMLAAGWADQAKRHWCKDRSFRYKVHPCWWQDGSFKKPLPQYTTPPRVLAAVHLTSNSQLSRCGSKTSQGSYEVDEAFPVDPAFGGFSHPVSKVQFVHSSMENFEAWKPEGEMLRARKNSGPIEI
ncbi:hypothetical protein BDN67DRAFT_979881 [Paxillus ammoniavirescens]|nr:hypothetical protein BDN67DRAFT_979881 [Paxillus ammoniavirescens]